MGMGIMSRLASGLRSTINTVSVGEAYLSKPKEVKAPERHPELGVLQFGTRFRGVQGATNPFLSGVRPATGPTVARPGFEQFKGTGGAFAPEQTMQITTGMRNLRDPMAQLRSFMGNVQQSPTMLNAASEMQSLAKRFGGGGNPIELQQMQAAGIPPDSIKMFQVQQMMEQMNRMVSTITSVTKAAHDVAMNAIRNMKA